MEKQKRIIIIGAGPGGYVAAIKAGQLGMDVTLIEKDTVLGGTCLHWGCIPTKALLHQSHLYHSLNSSEIIQNEALSINIEKLNEFKHSVINRMEAGIRAILKKLKVKTVQGVASLKTNNIVQVTTDDNETLELEADDIILATGSEARSLPGIEFDGDVIISNKEMLSLTDIPESLIVIGAGAVGVEFATFMHQLGKEVTILEMLPRIVPLEDEEVSKELLRSFKKKKIKAITGAMVTKIENHNGKALVTYTRNEKATEIEAEKVLIAIGRKPNIEDINLEAVGIEIEKGFVKVNNQLQTSVEGIWAIGDIINTPQLAHAASAEGINVVEQIAGLKPEPINNDYIPGATYCEPQVASVGMTEAQALEAGYDVKTGLCRFNTLAKAHILSAPEGFVKVVADKNNDKLLGLHIIGPEATEMIGEGVTALQIGATISQLKHSIHPHPTLSEVVYEAFESVDGSPIHSA